ncbi:MAG: hypothetical protein JWR75_393 [Devosia sp.]|nr:hypothetical protein [Devosia sp.]
MASSREDSVVRSFVALHLIALIIGLLLIVPSVGVSGAKAADYREFAGIVVDAKSGKILYESSADSARYPASVTKVMTLYVLFQELDAGNLKLSTKMKVSRHAADAVPTKLGLKAGSTITVENAILALVTLSANDMARVIAEHISGTESAFAERMTATAKALGMSNTTYRNASGLPDKGQVTTVKDQAILGIAIYQHFPKYYAYFQTKSFKYGKSVYGNHNRLLGVSGIDGIKTGFINASGFNLLTAARVDNRHIVVVGFGFESSSGRDKKVLELVKKYLPKARQGGYLDVAMIPLPGRKGKATTMLASTGPVFVTPMPFPSFRIAALTQDADDAEGTLTATMPAPTVAVAAIAPAPTPLPVDPTQGQAVAAVTMLGQPSSNAPVPYDSSNDVIGAFLSDGYVLGAPPTALGATPASAPLVTPIGVGDQGEPIDLMTSGAVAVASAESAAATPGWIVQIGAAANEDGARGLLLDATSRISNLDDFRPYVEKFEKNGQVFYRARFAGFGDRDDAATMCGELKKANLSCLAMQS